MVYAAEQCATYSYERVFDTMSQYIIRCEIQYDRCTVFRRVVYRIMHHYLGF